MAGTRLTRTMGTPTDATKQTLSVWIKLSSNSDYGGIVSSQYDSGSGGAGHFSGNNSSIYSNWSTNGSSNVETRTSALGRDFNGWYHIVSVQDAAQSGSDKSKIWINGVLQTGFAADNRSNFSTHANWFANGKTLYVGSKFDNSLNFDGVMTHLHLCDGYAYTASDFGSFDTVTGEWKINAGPNVNYGNEGFFILKDGNSITDQSGNGNDFTLSAGTLSKTEDCPSDIFCTYNRGHYLGTSHTLSNGNTVQKETSDVGQRQVIGTLGAAKGKYYAEFKLANVGSNVGGSYPYVGCVNINNYTYNTYLGNNGIAMHPGGNIYRSASVIDSQTSITYTTGDIVSVALDVDNLKAHFRVNGGTWLASGDPANNTGGYDISSFITENENFLTFASSVYNNNGEWNTNFGNGYFKTTAVSSAGTNASEIGIFEYDVPSGFTALSTKGLNSF